jgi:hypothetical protein
MARTVPKGCPQRLEGASPRLFERPGAHPVVALYVAVGIG